MVVVVWRGERFGGGSMGGVVVKVVVVEEVVVEDAWFCHVSLFLWSVVHFSSHVFSLPIFVVWLCVTPGFFSFIFSFLDTLFPIAFSVIFCHFLSFRFSIHRKCFSCSVNFV